jgi:hypothetical protein
MNRQISLSRLPVIPLLFVLSILPALLLAWLLLRYNVDVPFWDQWTVTATILKTTRGQLSFADLIAQHNESRKFFPRLIFIALAYLTRYDVRYETLVSFGMAAVISFSLYRISQLTLRPSPVQGVGLLILTNLLVFSPVQYAAWLTGLSNVVYISIACITLSLWLACTTLQPLPKFAIAAGLATISTFSFANGILSWVLILPVLVLNAKQMHAIRQPLLGQLLVGWLVAALVNSLVYFYHYTRPASSPDLAQAVAAPGSAIVYFLAFLGSQFGWGTVISTLTLSVYLGLILLAGWLLLLYYLLKFRQDGVLWSRSLPWLMLGCYALLSAAIAAVGRSGFGVAQSLESRYTTFAIYLPISLLYLMAIVLGHLQQHKQIGLEVWNRSLTAVLSCFLVFHLLTTVYSVNQMFQTRQVRLQGKACVLLINVAPDDSCIKTLYFGGVQALQPLANGLNQRGWMHPPLLQTAQIQAIATPPPEGRSAGALVRVQQLSAEQFAIAGWAVQSDRNVPADAVLLTYDNDKGESLILKAFLVGETVSQVPDATHPLSGWFGTVSLRELPAIARTRLKAWAFNVSTGKAFPLNGQQDLLIQQQR